MSLATLGSETDLAAKEVAESLAEIQETDAARKAKLHRHEIHSIANVVAQVLVRRNCATEMSCGRVLFVGRGTPPWARVRPRGQHPVLLLVVACCCRAVRRGALPPGQISRLDRAVVSLMSCCWHKMSMATQVQRQDMTMC